MAYYILYPKDSRGKFKVVTKKPTRALKNHDFADGPYRTIASVKERLNNMDVSNFNRPRKFLSTGI